MPGIPREFAEHVLHIKPNTKPVRQALQRFSEPKRKAIGEEVNRLLDIQFIRETKKASWIADPVLVPRRTQTYYGCVSTTGQLTNTAQRTTFPCLESIR